MTWQDRAPCPYLCRVCGEPEDKKWSRLCRDHFSAHPEVDIFFSDKRRLIGKAVAICNTCPVQAECLEDAVTVERDSIYTPFGVYGGRTPEQRRRKLRAV